MEFVLARLSEGNTWRGIIWLLTAFGVAISPDMQNAIEAAGMALVGALLIWEKEHKGKAIVAQNVNIQGDSTITTTAKGQ